MHVQATYKKKDKGKCQPLRPMVCFYYEFNAIWLIAEAAMCHILYYNWSDSCQSPSYPPNIRLFGFICSGHNISIL